MGFHLSIPMGYMYSDALFEWQRKQLSTGHWQSLADGPIPPPHPLESLSDSIPPDDTKNIEAKNSAQETTWANLSLQAQEEALAYVKVYLSNSIGVIQGDQDKRTHMTRCLFQAIYILLCPNGNRYRDQFNPISDKKLRKGCAIWITVNIVLGWSTDTSKQVLTLPAGKKEKIGAALESIPTNSHY